VIDRFLEERMDFSERRLVQRENRTGLA